MTIIVFFIIITIDHFHVLKLVLGFPGGPTGKEAAFNGGDLGWEDPLEKGMATHPSILAWRSPRTVYIVLGVTKSWTRLSGKL